MTIPLYVELDKLRAENIRLRKALEILAKMTDSLNEDVLGMPACPKNVCCPDTECWECLRDWAMSEASK